MPDDSAAGRAPNERAVSARPGAVSSHVITSSPHHLITPSPPHPPTPSRLPSLEPAFDDIESVKSCCAAFREVFALLRKEIAKVIVGQDEIVQQTLIALFANGHVLLEGVPGLGKTLLVRTLSDALSLPFARIQFTPDLMPADITGTNIVVDDPTTGRRGFEFRPGPIFHQIVLADEINRATPKSQAALLEAMQERSVTIAGKTHRLVSPFLVLATQNPIEQEGTYSLPEAQLDRFFFKVIVPYTTRKEMNQIVGRTTVTGQASVSQVLDGDHILQAQRLARRIIVAPHVQDYAIRLVMATHPAPRATVAKDGKPERARARERDIDRYIRIGVSPRGAQALIGAAKIMALIAGRYAVAFKDIEAAALPALRHRIIRSFEAEADGITTDDIVARLIDQVPHELAENVETSKRRNVERGTP